MKRIVLILFISIFGHSAKIRAQNIDSLFSGQLIEKNKSYKYIQFRTGLFVGYHRFKEDSANITLEIPLELNFRFFPKNKPNVYFDASVIGSNLFLKNNVFITTIGGSIGAGILSKGFNSNMQLHLGYLNCNLASHQELKSYKDLFTFGYTFETSSILFSFNWYHPIRQDEYKSNFVLVGIRFPLATIEL